MIDCNWLQSLEVGIDPAHTSFLHRFFHDEDPKEGYGKLFRDTSIDSEMPMTKIMREFPRPTHRGRADRLRLPHRHACGRSATRSTHVRVTNLMFPNAFILPMSREMTITQWHVPIDDTKHYWYAIFTSFGAPVNKDEMRRQRLELYELPDYIPRKNKTQRLRLRSARAGARHLHRHGRRHQRARPVGLRVDGHDPGPHPGASRPVRQGDHRLPAAAAAGDRGHQERRQAADGARRAARRRTSPAPPRSTASARPTTGRAIGRRPTSASARRRAGPTAADVAMHDAAARTRDR